MAGDRWPKSDPPTGAPHPVGEALAWAARIMAVACEMVLPGLAGHWLDQRWGTRFLVLIGFALGITAGLFHLLYLTAGLARTGAGSRNRPTKRRQANEAGGGESRGMPSDAAAADQENARE